MVAELLRVVEPFRKRIVSLTSIGFDYYGNRQFLWKRGRVDYRTELEPQSVPLKGAVSSNLTASSV